MIKTFKEFLLENESLTSLDQEYLKTVQAQDIKKCQELVDKEAKRNGYTIKAYHGTSKNFTKFKTSAEGIFFYPEEYKHMATGFAERRYDPVTKQPIDVKGGGKVLTCYLKIKKLFVKDYNGEESHDFFDDAEEAQDNGYDGMLLKNVADINVDEMYKDGRRINDKVSPENLETQYVVFNSNQIKLADPITYDKNGNVIPLSKRFNDKSKNIRENVKNLNKKVQIKD